MSKQLDLKIVGGSVVTPAGIVETDVGAAGGRIVALGDLGRADAAQTIDAHGLHVLPGVIDTQVHFREPGGEHKEDLESGSRAAVMGGVTAVFEMPNTNPLTTSAEALADKLARARGRMWCDHAFFVGGTAENAHELGELERLPGCPGIKIFMGSSTGNLLLDDHAALERALAHGRRRVAVHAEDEARLKQRKDIAEREGHPRVHPVWRDEETALIATRFLVEAAERAGRPVHVLHVTTADEMDFLRHHKDAATVEVTPNHLTLVAPDCYERLGTRAQMNPPVRDERHRQALWKAIELGIVDVIGSDHAPHTLEEKEKPYPASPSGMTGVQTTVPLMLDHVAKGRLSLLRLVDLLCAGPARIYGIAGKGRIVVGFDADFTIVDLGAEREITNAWIESRPGWTPFDGVRVKGWPVSTVLRGRPVMRDGALIGAAAGAPVRFWGTLREAGRA